MTDTLTLTGLVATVPRHLVTGEGLPITSFRLASSQRRFDRTQQKWVDGDTNWYTISTFRQFASNAAASLTKGDRVVVTGRLRIRDWESGERTGTTVEIEADALGPDLAWGTATFSRSIASSAASTPPQAEVFPAATHREGGEDAAAPLQEGDERSGSHPSAEPLRAERDPAESLTTPF